MLDMLAVAALNGAMVVAVANPPRLYKVDVEALASPSSAAAPDARPKLDCSKVLLTYGGIAVDTSLPLQQTPATDAAGKVTTADQQALDAVVASQLANGTHAPLGLSASGPDACTVSFIAADPLVGPKASEGSLRLGTHVMSSEPVSVTAAQTVVGYSTVVAVSPPPSDVAGASGAGGAPPLAPQECRTIVLTVGGEAIDTSKPFEPARPGRTGLLFPAGPARFPANTCGLVVATPHPITAAAARMAGVLARVSLEPSTPLYAKATPSGVPDYDLVTVKQR